MSAQAYGWRSVRLRLFVLFALVIAGVLFYSISDLVTQWRVMLQKAGLALGQ